MASVSRTRFRRRAADASLDASPWLGSHCVALPGRGLRLDGLVDGVLRRWR
jgi:hypothetical protein